jgi:hypothetical protein
MLIGTTIDDGAQNTADILAGCITNGIAADLASGDILSNGFTDWFLPSKDELNKLWMKKADVDVVGVFASDIYWSSSEFNDTRALVQKFSTGFQGPSGKEVRHGVRAVRAF